VQVYPKKAFDWQTYKRQGISMVFQVITYDHEKTKFIEQINKLFVISAEPCVKVLFHAIKSNKKERDEKIKLLQKENKEQCGKIEQLQEADHATPSYCFVTTYLKVRNYQIGNYEMFFKILLL